ncbi:MAG: glycosyltransferase family 39 protein [Chiayiivirga sp.]|nr:glycosyltransferase family 39 protein [Chiayiivirga sp.]
MRSNCSAGDRNGNGATTSTRRWGPWLGEAFVQLCGGRIESLYLLAQSVCSLTLFYVWSTARLWLDPARAALATVLLEGSYFHTYLIPNFNMNSLQLPLWAGFSYHLLRAMKGQRRTGTPAARWCGALPAGKVFGRPAAAQRCRAGARHGRRSARVAHAASLARRCCWRWPCSRRI